MSIQIRTVSDTRLHVVAYLVKILKNSGNGCGMVGKKTSHYWMLSWQCIVGLSQMTVGHKCISYIDRQTRGCRASSKHDVSACRHSQLQKLESDYGLYLHLQSALQSRALKPNLVHYSLKMWDLMATSFARDSIYAVSAHMLSQFRPSVSPYVCHTGDSCKNGCS